MKPENYWGPLSYIDKYNLKIRGIIHVGAHFAGEVEHYMAHNIKNIVFFEPLKDNFSKLLENVDGLDGNIITHNVALGNTNGKIKINLSTNNKASSSVLKPKLHLNLHPEVEFHGQEEVDIKKLDDYSYTNYNMLVVDVQGYEFEVLKGSWRTLSYVDYIFTEVNQDEVYENNANILELDSYLSRWNFIRVETTWEGGIWGDALYIKNYVE
jgi:FkbM family methyltransferase